MNDTHPATDTELCIGMTVITGEPALVTRTLEVFARAAAGLALEGLHVSVHASTIDDESEG